MKIYLVGGAVRDSILNLPIDEKDYVVVGSNPEELIKMGFKCVGKDFPVFLHPKTKEEYALARQERKTGQGYTGFSFYFNEKTTIEEDLKRRDLTINAIAMDEYGNYIDPYGGITDIKNQIIRHVSDAFSEDPLRVLRVARFQAKFPNFSIANETLDLLKEMTKKDEFKKICKERVLLEVHKSLKTEQPSLFFETLKKIDALDCFIKNLNIDEIKKYLSKNTETQNFIGLIFNQNDETLNSINNLPISKKEKYLLKNIKHIENQPKENMLKKLILQTDAIRKKDLFIEMLKFIDKNFNLKTEKDFLIFLEKYNNIEFPSFLKNENGDTIKSFYQNKIENILNEL